MLRTSLKSLVNRRWWKEGRPDFQRANERRLRLEERRIESSQYYPPVEPTPQQACELYRKLLKAGYAQLVVTDKTHYTKMVRREFEVTARQTSARVRGIMFERGHWLLKNKLGDSMVGKTYLRYVEGPQGGAVVSSGSLSVAVAMARPSYASPRNAFAPNSTPSQQQRPRHQQRRHERPHHAASAMIFAASLEAVRVFSLRSGALQHTLIPAEAKMPLEVTALRLVPLDAPVSRGNTDLGGWLLLVGYHNGRAAVFSCGPTNNYGLPVCRFYALGHKADTSVLALAVDSGRTCMCSGGQDTDVTVWDLVTHEASFRLRGHRGGVVGVEFVPSNDRVIVTGAADGLVKVWDTSIRQCVQTLVASDAQVTSLLMDSAGRRLYCGLRESHVKVFNTEGLAARRAMEGKETEQETIAEGDAVVLEHGSIARRLQKPVTSLSFSHDGAFLLACTSKTLEVFRVLSREDVRKKATRKRKRREMQKKSLRKGESDDKGEDGESDNEPDEGEKGGEKKVGGDGNGTAKPMATTLSSTATAAEEVVPLRTFFLDQKIRSASFVPPASHAVSTGQDPSLHIAVTFNNNTVRTFTCALTRTDLEGGTTWTLEDLTPRHSMDQQGHHSDIRVLLFADDDTTLVSLSSEKLMMWNLSVREDFEEGHATTHDFYDAREANVVQVHAKGSLTSTGQVVLNEAVTAASISSNLCCVGQKDGAVLLVDLPASEIVFTEPTAHVGGVKHITQKPDRSGFASVGADRRLIVWTLALLQEGDSLPQLLQSMEIELTESPLFINFSPDSRFAAVGLQNTNIQLFFADTMKPYLTLFGHKLPPIAADFSSDGTLIASVGMDKSLRFWGTDFGDCHRAIHAHDDYVTQVAFLRDTHQLFTVSLDGSVKHWDGDNWTMVQLARHHQRGVWAVAIASNGTCVATAGVDRCIRCLLRTQDIVFPAEEEERMAQEAMDAEVAKRAAMQTLEQQNPEVGVAGQQTSATAEAAEKLMEALDLVSVELQRRENPEEIAPPHPLLANKTPWEYLWGVVESIRPSEVRHALAALTSTHTDALLSYLESMLREGVVLNYEIAAKILLALVAPGPMGGVYAHTRAAAIAGEVSEAHGARRLASLRRMIAEGMDHTVGRMDYNIAGLQFVRQYIEDNDKTRFFDLSKIQGHKKKYHSRVLANKEKKI